ncbi:origin recognition complex protein 5 [Tasmannia lanceolata]|uniref:origin recognition complex protein 5 n=1 Tax=Tasmannia lanceolata TaxID=3420 RepID=UPI0040635F05
MGKEEGTLQITKRTTRSSSTTPSRSTLKTPKTSDPFPPSISNNLLFTEGSISLDNLLSNFPGRRLQICDILRLIGPPNCPMTPLFLYGGVSTGKTSVILQIFRHLNRPFVYSSCRSCYNPRILFESVLNQLLLHGRNASNGYSSNKRCERVSDFINFLRDALIQVIDSITGCPKKSGLKETVKQVNGRMIYLIFDNVELIRAWDKNSSIISVLFKINDILKMPEVGLIFISRATPDTYYSNTGFVEPLPIFFPDYTEDDIYQIFMRNHANPKLYSSFLDAVLKPFCRITRRVDELSIALRPLFQKYCEPLGDLKVVPDEAMKRRLFSHLQPHIAPSLNQTFKVHSQPRLEANQKKVTRMGNSRKFGSGEVSNELDFHMSLSAKYLLISAFLASRNPATLDAALFDSTGGSDNRKRRKKSSEISMERKENATQELLMRGPGTFPLERLLAIFQCITSVAGDSLVVQQEGGLVTDGEETGLMCDVLLQLSTLCNANFISKGGSCPLEGSTRYRSMVDEEMALKVARSVNFPLSKYLYRR